MACERYSEFMMQYMDGGILAMDDRAELEAHMDACPNCQEDFDVYSEILQGMSDVLEIVEAPDDFTPSVMAKVAELNLYAPKQAGSQVVRPREKLFDGMIFAAWLVFAAVVFGGTALAIFGEQMIEWARGQGFYILAEILHPMVNFTAGVIASVGGFFSNVGEAASGGMIFYSVAFLVLFACLVILQIYISPKKATQKIEARDR